MSDESEVGRPRVRETYHAAIQHDMVAFDGDERLVGVVRRPTRWFGGTVDENRSALGPPADLLDEFKERHEDLKRQGLCDEGAHNAAWEEIDYEARYHEHLETDPDARAALSDLVEIAAGGEPVVLVCYESDDKACHRHLVKEALEARLDSDAEGTDRRS